MPEWRGALSNYRLNLLGAFPLLVVCFLSTTSEAIQIRAQGAIRKTLFPFSERQLFNPGCRIRANALQDINGVFVGFAGHPDAVCLKALVLPVQRQVIENLELGLA